MMIAGIRVNGGCFAEGTELQLFQHRTKGKEASAQENLDRYSVIFGRNGSGKSSIGRALERLDAGAATEDAAEFEVTALRFEKGNLNGFPEGREHSVVVFNEGFVQRNLQVKESNGLGTIALFGEQGDYQGEIDKLEAEVGVLQKDLPNDQTLEKLSKAETTAFDELKAKVSEGWAENDRQIKGNKVRTQVGGRQLQELYELIPHGRGGQSISDLTQKFKDLKDEYDATGAAQHIAAVLPSIDVVSWLENFDEELLTRVLETRSASGVAGLVSKALEQYEGYVRAATTVFGDANVTHCPMCQQSVDQPHREELLQAIASLVDDETAKLIEDLDNGKVADTSMQIDGIFREKARDLVEQVDAALVALNEETRRWNTKLEQKKERLYSIEAYSLDAVKRAATSLHQRLADLEVWKVRWNEAVSAREKKKVELRNLNDQLVRLECATEFVLWDAAKTALKEAENKAKELREAIAVKNERLTELRALMRNVQVGADFLNSELAVIFAANDRLKLSSIIDAEGGTSYQILVRGQQVKPANLSVGERNVLALCYFFAKLRERLQDEPTDQPVLVVLDDPVSSVDVENRVGIHVYLEQKFAELLRGESSTSSARRNRAHHTIQLLVLTHDLTAARNFEKSGEELERHKLIPKNARSSLELCVPQSSSPQARRLEDRRSRKGADFGSVLAEYRTLLSEVYCFAAEKLDDKDMSSGTVHTIGNSMRRVLEAFGTFIYDEKHINSPRFQSFYEKTNGLREGGLGVALGPEFRQVLHGASHATDATASLSVFGGGVTFEAPQLQLTAQRLLALMEGLQPHHVASYLNEGQVETVRKWKDDLHRGAEAAEILASN